MNTQTYYRKCTVCGCGPMPISYDTCPNCGSLFNASISIPKEAEKIKLEDMTLIQMKRLKERIIEEIYFAINKATSGYDVGEVMLYADPDIAWDSCGRVVNHKQNIDIRFSKEDD